MPSAEIITIGTEILLGEIVDTNAPFIARCFRDLGIDLFKKTTVGDNILRIAEAIRQALDRNEIVLTTGGLGPTIDDATRAGVSKALDSELEFRKELWEQVQSRFARFNRQPTENNMRQAYVPKGALALENPVGTAPAFMVENGIKTIISLPGVPQEMEYLLIQHVIPYLSQRYHLKGIIKARIIHTAGIGESQIDDFIADLEVLENPTIGLSAHTGQVDVRITAKADTEDQADGLIQPVESEIRNRLSEWIYGADEETLEEVALQAIRRRGWTITVVESGLDGDLLQRLSRVSQNSRVIHPSVFKGGELVTGKIGSDELSSLTEKARVDHQVDVSLGVSIIPGIDKQDVYIVLITPEGKRCLHRPYGGPPEYAPKWTSHHSLNLVRQL